jgi:hypothetical protein
MQCFHGPCIMPWLEEHNTCPTCRLELSSQPRAEGRGAAAAARDAAGPSRPAAAQPAAFMGMMESLATMWELQAHIPDAEDAEDEEEEARAAAEFRRRRARQAERARYSEARGRSGGGQRRGMDGRPPPEPAPAPAPAAEPVRAPAATAANSAFAGAVAGGVFAGVVVASLLRGRQA